MGALSFSMFQSKSLLMHVLRGLAGVGLLALAVFTRLPVWASILGGVGGIAVLGGCPACWCVGLIETIQAKLKATKRRVEATGAQVDR